MGREGRRGEGRERTRKKEWEVEKREGIGGGSGKVEII